MHPVNGERSLGPHPGKVEAVDDEVAEFLLVAGKTLVHFFSVVMTSTPPRPQDMVRAAGAAVHSAKALIAREKIQREIIDDYLLHPDPSKLQAVLVAEQELKTCSEKMTEATQTLVGVGLRMGVMLQEEEEGKS